MAAKPRPHDVLESSRLPGWPFVSVAAGMLVFLALSIGGLWAVFVAAVPNRLPLPAHVPPAPRLQSDPAADLSAVLAQQRARLAGYRWVDRNKRIAAIPIDRAMAIIAGRGTDAYAPIPGAPPMPPQTPAPQSGQTPKVQP
jgi:hypothetical protein